MVALHDTTAEHEGAADDCEPDREVEKPRPRKDLASESASTLVAPHDITAEREGAEDDCEPGRKIEKGRVLTGESGFARLDGLGGSRGGRFDIVVQSMETFSRHRSMYQNDYG